MIPCTAPDAQGDGQDMPRWREEIVRELPRARLLPLPPCSTFSAAALENALVHQWVPGFITDILSLIYGIWRRHSQMNARISFRQSLNRKPIYHVVQTRSTCSFKRFWTYSAIVDDETTRRQRALQSRLTNIVRAKEGYVYIQYLIAILPLNFISN